MICVLIVHVCLVWSSRPLVDDLSACDGMMSSLGRLGVSLAAHVAILGNVVVLRLGAAPLGVAFALARQFCRGEVGKMEIDGGSPV